MDLGRAILSGDVLVVVIVGLLLWFIVVLGKDWRSK